MAEAKKLSHIDETGSARMVDVGAKNVTERVAVAKGRVLMKPETLQLIREGGLEKGDVLGVARLAGVMAAKRTADLFPLCHPIPLTQVTVDLVEMASGEGIEITATARAAWKTGVEMEALTAASVAGLTVYDMCKAVDRGMRIDAVRVVRKSGGKSGDFTAE
jgi:cyclic pyranopterin phosphate synthase